MNGNVHDANACRQSSHGRSEPYRLPLQLVPQLIAAVSSASLRGTVPLTLNRRKPPFSFAYTCHICKQLDSSYGVVCCVFWGCRFCFVFSFFGCLLTFHGNDSKLLSSHPTIKDNGSIRPGATLSFCLTKTSSACFHWVIIQARPKCMGQANLNYGCAVPTSAHKRQGPPCSDLVIGQFLFSLTV